MIKNYDRLGLKNHPIIHNFIPETNQIEQH